MHKRLNYILFIALIIASCGNSKETQAPNTIIFSFPERDLAHYRPLINEFYLAHPGLTVTLDPVPGDQLGGQKGDVQVVTWDIAGDTLPWSANNYINLNPLILQDISFDQDDFFPGVFIPFTNIEKLTALPYGMDLDVLFFNKEIFDNQGISPPGQNWNWNNFVDTAARLTEREQNVYGYSASVDYSDSLYFLYQAGGSLVTDESLPAVDTPVNIEAMSWYSRLFSTLNIAPTTEQAQRAFGFGNDVFAIGIANGQVGMWTGPYSTRGISPTNGAPLSFDYGMAPLPRGQDIFTSGTFEAYAISVNAKNVDASWKLIEFLSRKPNAHLIPARQSVASSVEFTRSVGAEAAAVAAGMAGHTIVLRYDQTDVFYTARRVFLEAVASIISLDRTTLQALQQAQSILQPK